MWHKVIQDNDPIDAFAIESQTNDYLIGEPTPDKPEGFNTDGGMLLTIKKPVLLCNWETFLEDKGSPVFLIYKYDIYEKPSLIYKETLKSLGSGINKLESNIFLYPGRYYFQLMQCSFATVKSDAFNPEHCFIAVNSGFISKDPPAWYNEPIDPNWNAFYNMLFRIQKSDLYLGLHSQMIKDNLLLKDAFYHAPDQDNILRTFIFDGKVQVYEGMKV